MSPRAKTNVLGCLLGLVPGVAVLLLMIAAEAVGWIR